MSFYIDITPHPNMELGAAAVTLLNGSQGLIKPVLVYDVVDGLLNVDFESTEIRTMAVFGHQESVMQLLKSEAHASVPMVISKLPRSEQVVVVGNPSQLMSLGARKIALGGGFMPSIVDALESMPEPVEFLDSSFMDLSDEKDKPTPQRADGWYREAFNHGKRKKW